MIIECSWSAILELREDCSRGFQWRVGKLLVKGLSGGGVLVVGAVASGIREMGLSGSWEHRCTDTAPTTLTLSGPMSMWRGQGGCLDIWKLTLEREVFKQVSWAGLVSFTDQDVKLARQLLLPGRHSQLALVLHFRCFISNPTSDGLLSVHRPYLWLAPAYIRPRSLKLSGAPPPVSRKHLSHRRDPWW